MKKLIRRAVKTFKKYADAVLLRFGRTVSGAMAAAPDVFPNPSPALKELDDALDGYEVVLGKAASRDRTQVPLKNKARSTVVSLLSQLTDYVNLVCLGEVTLLVQSALLLNKVPEPVTLKNPHRLVLSDGTNDGQIWMKFRSVKGAASYLFQYSATPDMAAAGLVSIPATTTSYLFTGLNKGTTYYFRSVAVGSNGQLAFSIVVNRVSQ